jgi:hypothetical protein
MNYSILHSFICFLNDIYYEGYADQWAVEDPEAFKAALLEYQSMYGF